MYETVLGISNRTLDCPRRTQCRATESRTLQLGAQVFETVAGNPAPQFLLAVPEGIADYAVPAACGLPA